MNDDRADRIGSGDIAAINGLSPYMTPHDVYARKLGLDTFGGNEATMHGDLFEPVIAEIYARRRGVRVVKHPRTVRLARCPYLSATPDYVVQDESARLVECKMVGARASFDWGQEYHRAEDSIPIHYQAQCQWQMHITDDRLIDIIACMGTESRIWTLAYDEEFATLLEDGAHAFWKYLSTRSPPPVDGSMGCRRLLLSLRRYSKPVQRDATDEERALVETMRQARLDAKNAELVADTAENRLRESIGDAERIFGDGWRIRYATTKAGKRPFNFDILPAKKDEAAE